MLFYVDNTVKNSLVAVKRYTSQRLGNVLSEVFSVKTAKYGLINIVMVVNLN